MTTSAIGSSPASSLTSAISNSQKLGQQDFLNLLVTQMTNQDPLSPQDDTQMVAQMAQFSSVQGISNMSATMDKIQAASLVGKTVNASTVVNGLSTPISGVVSSVSFRSDGIHLNVNNQDVTLDQVQGVQQ